MVAQIRRIGRAPANSPLLHRPLGFPLIQNNNAGTVLIDIDGRMFPGIASLRVLPVNESRDSSSIEDGFLPFLDLNPLAPQTGGRCIESLLKELHALRVAMIVYVSFAYVSFYKRLSRVGF